MIDGRPDPFGPSEATLKQLAGALPSMVQGFKKGKIGGKGTPVGPPKPRKVCPVCCKLHDLASGPAKLPESEPCKPCKAQLDAGYIAIITDSPNPAAPRRYAFIKCSNLHDMAGKVVVVSAKTMDAVQKKFEAAPKDNGTNTDQA